MESAASITAFAEILMNPSYDIENKSARLKKFSKSNSRSFEERSEQVSTAAKLLAMKDLKNIEECDKQLQYLFAESDGTTRGIIRLIFSQRISLNLQQENILKQLGKTLLINTTNNLNFTSSEDIVQFNNIQVRLRGRIRGGEDNKTLTPWKSLKGSCTLCFESKNFATLMNVSCKFQFQAEYHKITSIVENDIVLLRINYSQKEILQYEEYDVEEFALKFEKKQQAKTASQKLNLIQPIGLIPRYLMSCKSNKNTWDLNAGAAPVNILSCLLDPTLEPLIIQAETVLSGDPSIWPKFVHDAEFKHLVLQIESVLKKVENLGKVSF